MSFKDEGFAIVNCPELAQSAKSIFNLLGAEDIGGALRKLINIRSRSNDEYIGLLKAVSRTPEVLGIALSHHLIEICRGFGCSKPVLTTSPLLHVVHPDLVINPGKVFTPPHQDAISTRGPVGQLVVWIPLHDVSSKGSGYGLEVWPGSHLSGLLPSEDHAFGHQANQGAFNKSEAQEVEINFGQALIFSQYLLHKTSDQPGFGRIAISFRFSDLDDKDWSTRFYYNPFETTESKEVFPDGRHLAPAKSESYFRLLAE